MNILQYGFFTTDDSYDLDFSGHWSRPYEYKWVLDILGNNGNVSVHNTACGTPRERLWYLFKNFSDTLYSKYVTLNTDQHQFDITQDDPKYHEAFDYVLNISVIEHLPEYAQLHVIANLYKQLKPNGQLLITFDYPTVNLGLINRFVGIDLKIPENAVTPQNSACPEVNDFLHVLYLRIKKE